MEFVIDLEAQLPTRRFSNALLDDHQVIVLCRMAPFMQRVSKDVDLMKQLLDNLAFYAKFEINDQTGLALTDVDMTEAHSERLIKLQHVAFRQFREELPELPLANLGSIETREDLLWHLDPLSTETLSRLCDAVDIRSEPVVEYVADKVDKKQFLLENLIARYEKRISQIERINAMPLYPDEVNGLCIYFSMIRKLFRLNVVSSRLHCLTMHLYKVNSMLAIVPLLYQNSTCSS